jgi:hypothetical protein
VTPLVGVPLIINDARRALATAEGIGPDAADAMFDALLRRTSKKMDEEKIAEAKKLLVMHAHFGHRDHSDRSIMISEIGGS